MSFLVHDDKLRAVFLDRDDGDESVFVLDVKGISRSCTYLQPDGQVSVVLLDETGEPAYSLSIIAGEPTVTAFHEADVKRKAPMYRVVLETPNVQN